MSVVVIATISPQPEHAEEVRQAVLDTVPRVHEEPGCERYSLHQGRDGALVMVEKWESPEALATHGKADALSSLSGRLEGKLTGAPTVTVLDALPAGDAGKGAL
ncbi:quinol monooxygenase YgiN [Geodermatophilus tzadiensis]|uniref:Quinol monooxygenase YgiN n=1 Tax=Geodermatophilus tzadiensis TaxID=1137988 RepID=A0A2T0TU97_9ACTN|nr:putative quinol monooxygenase [Geodermatophilus tzadiensis]PRY49274.1 quinol monooxygenase YgiN [Geodermatophilus tzadiensis]